MKIRAAQLVLLLALASLVVLISGCATDGEVSNESARPWNAPADWEAGGALGGMDGMQHR
jgi:hypothetical protein